MKKMTQDVRQCQEKEVADHKNKKSRQSKRKKGKRKNVSITVSWRN